ncbi:MAG TPA: PhoH family protein [Planctomycetota bacterium]|nr:PhoH family protein [Planctomycetota bacterium]
MAEMTIPLRSHEEAILVLGPYDRHAKLLRQALDIEIFTRNGNLRLKGSDEQVAEARRRVDHLLGKLRKGRELEPKEAEAILMREGETSPSEASTPITGVRLLSRSSYGGARSANTARGSNGGERRPSGPSAGVRPPLGGMTSPGVGSSTIRIGAIGVRPFEPRGEHQRRYLEQIQKKSLVFGIGAAGTGKTYLAVAAAVRALRAGEVRRLVMTRPVVEAGEHLGFLPGDLQAKLDPYLRPVYDALRDLVDIEDIQRLEEAGVIEVAPLAYMRGRTLSNAFVILDEAQNTTLPQMKMFLTRLGEGSRMVVTGDPSQTDLERGQRSGLADAVARLQGFADVGVTEFTVKDVCRHPLVEQIVRAYESPARGLVDEGQPG